MASQDPFVHLSGVERQKVLKNMNFRQIEKAKPIPRQVVAREMDEAFVPTTKDLF
jgi:hypothetical protein